ncbi:MAG: hypothetical protein ABL955_01835 [Elusimicrobiota bacterium]
MTLALNEDRELKGIYLEEKGSEIWIGIDQGEIGVDRKTIISITAEPNDDTEFNARKAKLAAADVAGHWRLAKWARAKRLESSAIAEAETVLALEPSHPAAHEFLGHELHEGKWLSHDEVMKAKGFLDYRGRWVSREEFTKLEAIQLAEDAQTARTRDALIVSWRQTLQQSADSQYRTAVEAERIRKRGTRERILIHRH